MMETVANSSTVASQDDLHATLQQIAQSFNDHATVLATTVEPAEAGWYPTDLARIMIESMHVYTGLEWWAAIAATTVIVRGMLFPITIKLMRGTSKLQICKPEVARLVAKHNAEKANNPNFDKVAAMMEINKVYEKHGTHPMWTIGLMFTQMPIFVSMFLGLRTLENYYPEICQGGAFWFQDLGLADPQHILPVMASATFCATILLGDASMGETNQGKTMKRVMLGMGLLTVPISWNFPAAVLVYWVSNNCFSIVQTGLLNRVPGVKPFFGILPPPTEEDKLEEVQSQFAGIKAGQQASFSGMAGMAGMPPPVLGTAPKAAPVTPPEPKAAPVTPPVVDVAETKVVTAHPDTNVGVAEATVIEAKQKPTFKRKKKKRRRR